MCSSRRCGSTDRQHDLFGSGHDLDLRSNFQRGLSRSTYISFDAPRQEKHDAGKINVVPLLSQKLLQKNLYCKKRLFLEFLLPGGQTVDLRSNLRTLSERALKELSNALLRSTVALLVPELCASLSKNVEIGQI